MPVADVERPRGACRSLDGLDTVIRRKAAAGLGPVDAPVDELGDDTDDLVDVANELPSRVAFPTSHKKKRERISDQVGGSLDRGPRRNSTTFMPRIKTVEWEDGAREGAGTGS